MVVTNLSDNSTVSKRFIKDHANSIKPPEVIVTSVIIASVNYSTSQYRMYLSNNSHVEKKTGIK